MADFDPQKALSLQAGEIADQVEYVGTPHRSLIDEISLGVLFIMAFWSGPSRQAFQHLIESIAAFDSDRKLRIVVADIDGMQQFHESVHFDAVELGGWGETFWAKDGKLVSKSGPGFDLECVIPNTLALLQEAQ